MNLDRSRHLIKQACKKMPAGVNSPVRAFGAVGGDPIYIAKAKGANVTDVDGNTYLDYVCSWGPLILGHADQDVVSAIQRAAELGTSYGAPHEGEIKLAETIVDSMPCVEMLRFVNSGTEATMSALRLARAATGRSKIVKFEGNYHGHVDYLLVKAGSGMATFGLPDSSGVPAEFVQHTLVSSYNHLDEVESLFNTQGDSIAAVILEPVAGNTGVIPPAKGFLDGLRALTEKYGALLIFDEVITGFRVSRAGAAGLYDIQPDLVCLGKIIGGGLPVGAYGGRRQLMEQVAPLGPVYQAGTLSGNPLAMAAGLATTQKLKPDTYSLLEKKGRILEEGLREAAAACEVPIQINRIGSMLSAFFSKHPATDSATALSTDRDFYGRFFHAMLEQGVYLPPSALETWFVSAAHTKSDIKQTIEAFHLALEKALPG